ncbi:capsule synthesis protein CapA [Gordonia polyisoprenivorans VH2]|uniref:Capsule synthesis protein CapA n=1 Tax=Gordonia polyisoprenivorans (strain DSM 44266 / VH2) TaxID=1112204 RepID=H6MSD2_GORPV|nr:capsule synthesis protein CapA [Gordonia polyisoprenivorans VH2]
MFASVRRRSGVWLVVVIGVVVGVVAASSASSTTAAPVARVVPGPVAAPPTPRAQQLVLSFTGDNILGTDDKFSTATSLPTVWADNGRRPDYFFQNVKALFAADDLTVANFEVALTRRGTQRYKGEGEVYHFHGDPALAATLPAGGIDVVTVANNHTFDYGQVGFDDTLAALRGVGVEYFGTGDESEGSGYDLDNLTTIKGVRFGFVGYQAWADSAQMRRKLVSDIKSLRARGADVVIPFMHWGIESEHEPYGVQTELAHLAIDAGADLVVGTHPHVIQSMEIYRGKLIAYSFGNFAFGGNSNPTDKRTFILQTRFDMAGTAVRGVDFRVIPTRVSRTESYNDYVPTPYPQAQAAQVLTFINGLSPTLNGRAANAFVPVNPNNVSTTPTRPGGVRGPG